MNFKINNIDITTLGLALAQDSGLESFVALPSAKEVLNYNWADENGTEYDLDAPMRYEARVFKLKFVLQAKDLPDYLAKKNAVRLLLTERKATAGGAPTPVLTFTSDLLPEVYQMRYKSTTSSTYYLAEFVEVFEVEFNEIITA